MTHGEKYASVPNMEHIDCLRRWPADRAPASRFADARGCIAAAAILGKICGCAKFWREIFGAERAFPS